MAVYHGKNTIFPECASLSSLFCLLLLLPSSLPGLLILYAYVLLALALILPDTGVRRWTLSWATKSSFTICFRSSCSVCLLLSEESYFPAAHLLPQWILNLLWFSISSAASVPNIRTPLPKLRQFSGFKAGGRASCWMPGIQRNPGQSVSS